MNIYFYISVFINPKKRNFAFGNLLKKYICIYIHVHKHTHIYVYIGFLKTYEKKLSPISELVR